MASQRLSAGHVWRHRWEVESHTVGGKTYVVGQKADGSWGCACPAWIFNKERPRQDCKHIREVKFNEPVDMAKTSPAAARRFQEAARNRQAIYIEEPVYLQKSGRAIRLVD